MKRRPKVIVVAGARPNFIKIAPLMKEFVKRRRLVRALLVHTGQHYDFKMSKVFFRELDIPDPDIYLSVGSGTHAEQTARVLSAFEKVLVREKPNLVIVVGDVNSTMACAMAAVKLGVKVAHVEAGLRSRDVSMPEEINRLVTDRISDILFASEESGVRNLKREGVSSRKIFFSGNVMIDSLMSSRAAVAKSGILTRLGLLRRAYGVLTLHRPGNVDSLASLETILGILTKVCESAVVVYPVHPRTEKMIETHGLMDRFKAIRSLRMTPPLGYIDFIRLLRDAAFVMTDSGGIQEETTVLGVPCLTLRKNTERPSTITQGTNRLVGLRTPRILRAVRSSLKRRRKATAVPRGWDGHAARRIAAAVLSELNVRL